MYGLRVSGAKAKKLVASGAILIDARDAISFRDGTIAGAINLPLYRVAEMMRHDRRVSFVVFGDGPQDENALQITKYLSVYGFSNVYLLDSKVDWDKS